MRAGQRAIVPFSVLLIIILWRLACWQQEKRNAMKPPTMHGLAYVTGFFEHDKQPTGPEQGFRAKTLPNFGILDQKFPSDGPDDAQKPVWERFQNHIRQLNEHRSDGFRYKVLFIGRHGEGIHNMKEREVGRYEWERYWSKVDGDGNLTWVDSRLTSKGREQAGILREFWKENLATSRVPIPQKFYTSPLTRCLETANLTFSGIDLPAGSEIRPVITEALREINGVHTCNKRHTRSWIEAHFAEFTTEHGFTEEDELWNPDRRETLEERIEGMREFLERIFRDEATFISLTTHSGAIRALYLATGHPDVMVATGATVPVVLRYAMPNTATRINDL